MALASQQEVEQFADTLSDCANALHARLMQAIKDQEIGPDEARVAFQQETALRQQANSLFIDAATLIVAGLDVAQNELMGTIQEANRRIAKIKKVAALLDFLTDVLALAMAAYTAKPKLILAALKEVKHDLDGLQA